MRRRVWAVVLIFALMVNSNVVLALAALEEDATGILESNGNSTTISVSLGSYHSAAITQNGDLYCWGDNDYGQVGNGTTDNQSIPVKVLENVASVSPGSTSAAVTKNGDLYCWGITFMDV